MNFAGTTIYFVVAGFVVVLMVRSRDVVGMLRD